jgi:predicted ATPase
MLDHCDNVIEAAAHMVDVLLRSTSSVCVLATSRKPLRAPGEDVYSVPALAIPAEDNLARDEMLQAGAVQLFMERAHDAEPQFSPEKRVAAVAAICRQLEGIPLAIELAAARTSALGVDDLSARLADRFKHLRRAARYTLEPDQVLRAALDWSYELLPATERAVLRRLSVFIGSFTLEAATAVTGGDGIADSDVFDYVTNLVAKSLVATYVGRTVMHYRLPETTRTYAAEKLNESGEFQELTRRYGEYQRERGEVPAATVERLAFARISMPSAKC